MTALEALAVAAAGLLAGMANTIAGGGSLVSYPALLATGLNPLAANVTNAVGLLPGYLSGARGYRPELGGQRRRLYRLMVPVAFGAVAGTALLLKTPASIFSHVVPWLIIVGCMALLLQPGVARLIGEHSGELSPALFGGLFLGGIYGGYFGAALGVILLALLALFVADDLQRLNAMKIMLSLVVNLVAVVGFVLFGPVHWMQAGALAVGALIGGSLGALVGRRIPPTALRYGVAVIGLGVAIKLLLTPS